MNGTLPRGYVWKEVSLRGLINHYIDRWIVRDLGYCEISDRLSGVVLNDGSVAVARSEYEEDWSEVTPGGGVEPPTFWIGVPKDGAL